MREIITLSLLTTFLVSCSTGHEETITYFGGEIINPNSPHVVLYKNDNPVDTATLDDNNRFMMKLTDMEEGVYHFEHKPEFQYVFIEKGDSILIRLNTYDFDESLVFSGKGADKNNFLIEMYLMNEDEEHIKYGYYELDAMEFRIKMDSLRAMKLEQHESLTAENELSEDAINITRAGIDYIHYASMEIYPYMNKMHNNLDNIGNIPDDFYDYREALNVNDDRLSYYRPYFNYMVARLNNLSYVHHMNRPEGVDGVKTAFIEKTPGYHTYKLNLVDSLVENPGLKDALYKNTAYFYFMSNNYSESNNRAFIKEFDERCQNEDYVNVIHGIHTNVQGLQAGKVLSAFPMIDVNGDNITSDTVLGKNVIFYFWSVDYKTHIEKLSKKVAALEAAHPSYRFVGVNINENDKKWLKYVNGLCMDPNSQFRTAHFPKLREKLMIRNLNRVIITKGDGTIIDAFADIYDKDLEETLKANRNGKNKALAVNLRK